MNRLLHNPSTTNIELWMCVALFGVIGLWLIVLRILRSGKQGDQAGTVTQAEINSTYDADEIGVETALQFSVITRSPMGGMWLRLCALAACCALIVAGTWFCYTNYTIVHSWAAGDELLTSHDEIGAERLYRKAVNIDPQIRKSHLLLAEALMAGRDPLSALPELRTASRGERSDPTAPMLLGDELKALSRLKEAVEAYRQAIVISPSKAILYVRLATCLALLKRSNDAITQLRYAVLLDPKSGMAKGTLGQLLVSGSNKEEGFVMLRQAVQLSPDDVTTHNNLGCAYAQDKRYSEAISEFRQGLALDPEFAIAYLNLGCALRDSGDGAGAMQSFDACIRTCLKRPLYRNVAVTAEIELQKLRRTQIRTQ